MRIYLAIRIVGAVLLGVALSTLTMCNQESEFYMYEFSDPLRTDSRLENVELNRVALSIGTRELRVEVINNSNYVIYLDIERKGIIKNVTFFGDFFCSRDIQDLEKILVGQPLEYNVIKAKLHDVDVSLYFHALDNETFISLLID